MALKTFKIQAMLRDRENSIFTLKSGSDPVSLTWTSEATQGDGEEMGKETTEVPGTLLGTERVVITSNRTRDGRTVATAPGGVFFTATATGFFPKDVEADPFQDLHYCWDFGDPGHYTRYDTEDLPWDRVYAIDGAIRIARGPDVYDEQGARVGKATLVPGHGFVPDGGSKEDFLGYDRNIAYGPHAAHVFAGPGSYSVVCRVTRRNDDGTLTTVASEPFPVTMEDPNTIFMGARTIYVSPSRKFDGVPAANQKVTTIAEALTAAVGKTAPYVRILLRRGEKHIATEEPAVRYNQNYEKIVFGAYGDGTAEIPDAQIVGFGPALNAIKGENAENTIWGIHVLGDYDAADPGVRDAPSASGVSFGVKNVTSFKTVWDCRLEGVDTGVSIYPEYINITVGNTFIGNWCDYGMQSQGKSGYVGLCGVWIKQKPDAIVGWGKGAGEGPIPYVDHGCFRCSSLGAPFAFNLVDMRSVGSWAPGSYNQPCLRLGRTTEIGQTYIEEAVIERVRGENGGVIGTGLAVDDGAEGGGNDHYGIGLPRRYLFDKIYQLRANEGSDLRGLSGVGVSGPVIRNSVSVLANQPQIAGAQILYCAGAPDSDKPFDELMDQYGIDIYSNTYVDLRDATVYTATEPFTAHPPDAYSKFRYFHFHNNLIHVPNRDNPDSGVGLDSTVLWKATYPGLRYEDDPFQEIYKTPEDSAAVFAPTADVELEASGTKVAIDDFFGRMRTKPSQGAVEPI